MKKMVIAGLVIFIAVIAIGIGTNYLKKNAFEDANNYLCEIQSSWGSQPHFHFTDAEGKKYACQRKP